MMVEKLLLFSFSLNPRITEIGPLLLLCKHMTKLSQELSCYIYRDFATISSAATTILTIFWASKG